MPTITFHTTVVHNGKIYAEGEQHSVDDTTAQTLAAFSTRTEAEKQAEPTVKPGKPSETPKE